MLRKNNTLISNKHNSFQLIKFICVHKYQLTVRHIIVSFTAHRALHHHDICCNNVRGTVTVDTRQEGDVGVTNSGSCAGDVTWAVIVRAGGKLTI